MSLRTLLRKMHCQILTDGGGMSLSQSKGGPPGWVTPAGMREEAKVTVAVRGEVTELAL